MGIAPVVTVLLAPLIHSDEVLNWRMIIGIFIGFCGLIVLIGPDALQGLGDHVLGQFAALGAALCYAFTTLFIRKYANQPALVMAAGSMLIGAVIISVFAMVFDEPLQKGLQIDRSLLAAIYLGLVPTALATLIYFYLIAQIGAGRMSQVNFVVPIVGTVFGIIFYDEPLKSNVIVAMGLIFLAVFLVTRRKPGKV